MAGAPSRRFRSHCNFLIRVLCPHRPAWYPFAIGALAAVLWGVIGRNSELLDALNTALAEMRHDGTLNELERKWLGP